MAKITPMASSKARSALAVLAGWASVGVLVVATDFFLSQAYPGDYTPGRMAPDRLAAVSLATSTVWSVLGGWVTARMAPLRPWVHILGLLIWGELLGGLSAAMTWGQTQLWYQVGLLALWTPAVALGGWLALTGRPAR